MSRSAPLSSPVPFPETGPRSSSKLERPGPGVAEMEHRGLGERVVGRQAGVAPPAELHHDTRGVDVGALDGGPGRGRNVKIAQGLAPQQPVERHLLAAQERLSEPTIPEKIEVLLLLDHAPVGQLPDLSGDLGRVRLGLHLVDARLREELQAVPARVRGELAEVHRLVGGREVVVEEEARGVVEHRAHLVREHRRVAARGLRAVRHEAGEGAGLGDLLFRIGDVRDVEPEDLPDRLAQMAAGIGVVADERHPVRRQVRRADGEDPVAHRLGHPRVDTRRDDVVEGPEGVGDVHDVEPVQHHVPEAERRDRVGPDAHRGGRQVDADEFAVGETVGHRDQVAAVAAAQLQHAAPIDRSRGHSVQQGDRGQPIGMGLRHGLRPVREPIVGTRRRRGHGAVVPGLD